MSDEEAATAIDPILVDRMTEVIRQTAIAICAEQPDVPEPQDLSDLDSFSVVQVLLDLENELDVKLLEELEGFRGKTFREISEYIVDIADRKEILPDFTKSVDRVWDDKGADAALEHH